MLVRIVEVQLRGGHRLFLRFDDGVEGEIDFAAVTPFEGVFARLADEAEFSQVYLDHDWGTICWPGDLDVAPETLHAQIR
jgi:hypothetical protein